jgi:hypothetical protein
MVLRDKKVIFFHIPKVAGYSIEQFLYPSELEYKVFHEDIVYGIHQGQMTQHLDYNGMLKYLSEEYMQSCFKFAFVRNPWDRLHSAFSYLKPIYTKRFGGFEGFIKDACLQVDKKTYPPTGHIKPQSDYLFDKNGKMILNFIGKYESLTESFDVLKGLIGMEGTLAHFNKSPLKTETYKDLYTPELIDLVAKSYQKEIDYLGYSF